MKRIAFLIIIPLFYYACKDDVKIPQGILPPDKMEAVLLDMIRADEIINRQTYTDSFAKTPAGRITLYQDVFSAHKLNKDQFQKSLNFYQNRPDLLKIVLDSMQSETKRAEKRINDSLSLKLNKKAV